MEKIILEIRLSQSNIKSHFSLDQDQKFYDVILQVDDIKLYCHRIILTQFSSFFETMFAIDMMESKQNLIELKDIDPQSTSDIIRCMYGQKLTITLENAELLAITASRLLVLPIVDSCCEIISRNIDITNFMEIYLFAETYQFEQIIDESLEFMICHFKACSENSDFHLIPPSMLTQCLQSDDLCITNEVDLLYIVQKWYNDQQPQCNDDELAEIFENIRLPIIPLDDLIKFEEETKLFDTSSRCLDVLNKAKAFYSTPEIHFSKLCQLNYRYETKDFDCIHKISKYDNYGKMMVQIRVNNRYLECSNTFLNVEAFDRIHYAAVTIGHRLFLMGGTTKDETQVLSSIIAFDTKKQEWINPKLPPLPNTITGLSACLDDNRLYVIGGCLTNEGVASNEVAYLQSGSDDWVSVCPMNIARKFSIACALDHFIYVMGGDTDSSHNSLERYNPTTDTWELLLPDVGVSIERCSRLTAFNGHLYHLAHLTYSNFGDCVSVQDCTQYDPLQNKITNKSYNKKLLLRSIHFIDELVNTNCCYYEYPDYYSVDDYDDDYEDYTRNSWDSD